MVSSRLERRYVPIKDRRNFGELRHPSLRSKDTSVVTLADMKKEDLSKTLLERAAISKRVSKSNKRMNLELGSTSEYRQIRHNLSYKRIIDLLGEDLPIHPEYFYVMDIVLRYYGVKMSEVLEFAHYMETTRYDRTCGGYATRTFNVVVSACFSMLIYVMYVQYQCNPNTVMYLFGIGVNHLRSTTESFLRAYQNSEAVRADYSIIHGRLIKLEPVK